MLRKNTYFEDRIIIDGFIIVIMTLLLWAALSFWFKPKIDPSVGKVYLSDDNPKFMDEIFKHVVAYNEGYQARIVYEQDIGAGLAPSEGENSGS